MASCHPQSPLPRSISCRAGNCVEPFHAREGGRCFYCLRRLATSVKTLDHVVLRSLSGGNSNLNLVSACVDCNSQKGEKRAEDFLRWLYRERRLTAGELHGRLRVLESLAEGKLRPVALIEAM